MHPIYKSRGSYPYYQFGQVLEGRLEQQQQQIFQIQFD
jgi:hypothetical protein